jgi:hypothetical protein
MESLVKMILPNKMEFTKRKCTKYIFSYKIINLLLLNTEIA